MIKLHEEYVVNEKGKCSAVILPMKEYKKLLHVHSLLLYLLYTMSMRVAILKCIFAC